MRFLTSVAAFLLLAACGAEEPASNLTSTFPTETTETVLTDLVVERNPDGIVPDSFSITIKAKIFIAENNCLATGRAGELEESRQGSTLIVRPVVKKIDPRDSICTEEYRPVERDVTVTWHGSRSDTKKIVIMNVNQKNESFTIEP